ncbi:MAG TPA: alkaline shock response membrane anchor protein AmaP [Firmicutes bacterium]|nr:alkaline shock response membrane anchor protein AmaP [Bacillota bacterium]
MGSGDRLLAFLTSIFLLLAALGLALTAAGVPQLLSAGSTFFTLYLYGRWQTGVAALLVLLMAVRLAYVALPWRREGQILVLSSELGEVSIALTAIENLVQRTATQVAGVKDVRSTVRAKPEGVSVGLLAWVGSEVNVPTLSAELQKAVGQRLQEVIGLKAAAIRVAIKDIGADKRLTVR